MSQNISKNCSVFCCLALLLIAINCGKSSTEPETTTLLGTWKLDQTIFTYLYVLKDTLSSDQNDIQGFIELRKDSTYIYFFDVNHIFTINTIPIKVDYTLPDTGTWHSNDTLLVLTNKISNKIEFNYSIKNSVLNTRSDFKIGEYDIKMDQSWIKQ